ncbi:MAG: hypothetical protein JST92_08670 [Deltaproteobacteria bacterium]|nr:hypothetical protein [Deltaproteobacteria bacterium]
MRARGVAFLHAALLFVCVPGLGSAFLLPKLCVLLAGAAWALGVALRQGRRGGARERGGGEGRGTLAGWLVLALLAWVGASTLHADRVDAADLMLVVAGLVLLLGLLRSEGLDESVLPMLARLGTLEAALVLLQMLGLDPLRGLASLAGLQPAHLGARLAIEGSLGNPDFVAAWLSAALCLTLGEAARAQAPWARWRWLAQVAAQLVALAGARSFATIASLALAGVVLGVVGRRSLKWAEAVVALIGLGALAGLVADRDLLNVGRGRALLWGLADHLAQAPMLGHGIGAVRTLRAPSIPLVVLDHAHADPLELALGAGLPALLIALALFALALLALHRSLSTDRPRALAMGAALLTLASRSLVDFPLSRPAELALFVTLVSLALRRAPAADTPSLTLTTAALETP